MNKKIQKSISIIVAIAENNAIGLKNDLLCHLPADLKRFKQITEGNVVVMGKRTFDSLPVRPLKNRINIVISDNPADKLEGCLMAYSIEEAVQQMSMEKENFIIGGGSIYRQFMPLANKLYLTIIHKKFEADVFFPEIHAQEWNLIEQEYYAGDEKNLPHTYHIYERIQL